MVIYQHTRCTTARQYKHTWGALVIPHIHNTWCLMYSSSPTSPANHFLFFSPFLISQLMKLATLDWELIRFTVYLLLRFLFPWRNHTPNFNAWLFFKSKLFQAITNETWNLRAIKLHYWKIPAWNAESLHFLSTGKSCLIYFISLHSSNVSHNFLPIGWKH